MVFGGHVLPKPHIPLSAVPRIFKETQGITFEADIAAGFAGSFSRLTTNFLSGSTHDFQFGFTAIEFFSVIGYGLKSVKV